jgi:ABC-type branched-subunit amino acid transport system substrate-binding protein
VTTTQRPHPRRRLPIVLAAVALLAAACGGGDEVAGTSEEADDGAVAGAPEPVDGFDGTTINVGSLVPLSGLPAIIGTPLATGQQTYWSYVNEELGGVAGEYPVDLTVEDTLYETSTTVQKYNKIKNDVVMFAQVMGTPHNLALLPLLQSDDIVVSPASQDALWVREAHLLPIIEPYQIDVINAVDYWLNEGGGEGKKVGIILQNDVYGEAGLEGLEYAAENMGFDIVAAPRFKLGDGDFTAQINELRSKGAEMVWAVALPSEFVNILGTAARLGFEPQWIAQSPAWVDVIASGDLQPYLEEHVWIAATGPEWGDESVPGMAKMLERVERYRPDQEPDYYFSFGYYQAMAVHQVLEEAVARGDLGREGIMAAMNGLDELTFEGIIGDYGYGPPEDRDPSRQSTVFRVNMEKPFGLEALKVNFTSEWAEKYEFESADS